MRLFIGSLSGRVSEGELWNAFERFGLVESVTIIFDQDTGRSKGFAFVEMTKEGEAEAAIRALDGTMLGDRALHVAKARPREAGGAGRRFPRVDHR